MYDYHIDLVLKIDAILIAAILTLAVLIVFYSLFQWHAVSVKKKKLYKTKENIYAIFASGKDRNVCLPARSRVTAADFLDVVTNRKMWAAFFNKEEQDFFKQCFVSQGTITKLERTAKRGLWKWKRIEAILALGYAGASSAIGIFESGLFGRDKDVSYFSMIALGQIKTDLAARILLAYLRKDRLAGQKISSIMETFPSSAAAEVVKVIHDTDPSVRFWALKILSRLKPSAEYASDVALLAHDDDPAVRACACECLGVIGGAHAAGVLLKALKDSSWLVRAGAAHGLANALGPESVKSIIGLLNDSSLNVITAAKDVLASYIDEAAPYLEKILAGDDPLAKQSAIEVLSRSGYINRIIKASLRPGGASRPAAMRSFELILRSGAYLSAISSIAALDDAGRRAALDIIRGFDKSLADEIARRLEGPEAKR